MVIVLPLPIGRTTPCRRVYKTGLVNELRVNSRPSVGCGRECGACVAAWLSAASIARTLTEIWWRFAVLRVR
eukprot:scaffold270296_cov41-Tisochrysis_lutea.AAC.1